MFDFMKLPENLVGGSSPCADYGAWKRPITGISEIQQLEVAPWTTIRKHKHVDDWEVWVWPSEMIACVCEKGESHQLVNNYSEKITIMAIKGYTDYSFSDLEDFFRSFGFVVSRNSLTIRSDGSIELE